LVRGRTSCADKRKNKRERIIGEGSFVAKEGGVQQNYLEEFRRRRVTTVMYQCKHGGVVQSYYEQGYNNQYYQYQPPAED
jgi:hypothetical protein